MLECQCLRQVSKPSSPRRQPRQRNKRLMVMVVLLVDSWVPSPGLQRDRWLFP
ncbi:hypothetical protein D9M73_289610 [compost metagenome]